MEVVRRFRHALEHRSLKLDGNREFMSQAAKLNCSALQELKGDGVHVDGCQAQACASACIRDS
eukprot:6946424-Heterocapsa_arctica.AAC.1